MFTLIPSLDWWSVGLAVAGPVIGAVIAWLSRQTRLPAGTRRWLARIGQDEILDIIKRAEAYTSMTANEKRVWAVGILQEIAEEKLGITIPTSVANLLVEFVYQLWRKTKK